MTAAGTGHPDAAVLEREPDLAAVDALLRDLRDGRGRLLAFEAAPGLGKSTLLARAAATAAAAGVRPLRAAGRELERDFGWGVARRLFEPWLLGLPQADRAALLAGPAAPAAALLTPAAAATGLPAGREAGFALMHGLYWLTVRAAERGPLLLVVDDLHWADEPSVRLLSYLAPRLEDQQAALLVASRTGEPGAGGLVPPLLADPSAQVRTPASLSAAAVATLVRDRFAAADDAFCSRCRELTAGNPLFVRELLRALEGDDPADLRTGVDRAATSVGRLVLRRLAALPPAAQALARAAAVADGGLALDDAARLAGLDHDEAVTAADLLARHDVLRAGDPLEFVHPLLRSAVDGTLGAHERIRLHARAAALLAARGASAGRVASHLLHTAPDGDAHAVATLRAAAAEALSTGAPASALAYLHRALREPPAAGERPAVLAELGRAALMAGRREAADHFRAAADGTPDVRRRAALRLELGRALHDFGRLEDACATCAAALEELGPAGPDDELALDLEAWYLTSAMLLADRADDAIRRAAAIRRHPPTGTRAGRTLVSKAMALQVYAGGTAGAGTFRDALALGRGLWADGRLLADDGLATQAVQHVAGMLSYCDDYAGARAVLEAARARARREGWATFVAGTSQLLSRQALWTGPLAEAIDDARVAFDIFAGGLQLYLPATGYCLARGLLESGDAAQAGAVVAQIDRGPRPGGMFAAWRAEIGGRLAAARGDAAEARDAFVACGEHLAPLRLTNPAMYHWRSEAGLAAARAGDDALARVLVAEETALAERFGAPRALGVARRAAGLVAGGDAAVALLEQAVALHAGCGAGLEHARSLTELGAALRRARRRAEAREALREATARADALGARPLAAQARAELQRAGGRAAAAPDTANDLTPGERRVAALAAAGRANRQIADELFVTVKAVEWHLGNAYRKLGIRGRPELAAALSGR